MELFQSLSGLFWSFWGRYFEATFLLMGPVLGLLCCHPGWLLSFGGFSEVKFRV